ncbi:MAG: phasin family protein [Acetobacteraceae bacterium]
MAIWRTRRDLYSGHRPIQEITRMTMKPKTIESAAMAEETVATAAGKGFETTVSGLKDGMSQAAAGFAETQVKVKQGMEKAMKTAEELVAFSQGNVEAMVKSSQVWAAGVQDISKQMTASAQASFEETVSTFKALSSVKSLKDAFELQASFARSTMEKTLAESGRLTDASLKLTEQALAPLTERVSIAVEKFAKVA